MSAEEARDVRLPQASIDMEGSARAGGVGWSRHEPDGLWIPELTASSSFSGETSLTSLVLVPPAPHVCLSILKTVYDGRNSAGLSSSPEAEAGSEGAGGLL